jgi:hypothetical protein
MTVRKSVEYLKELTEIDNLTDDVATNISIHIKKALDIERQQVLEEVKTIINNANITIAKDYELELYGSETRHFIDKFYKEIMYEIEKFGVKKE